MIHDEQADGTRAQHNMLGLMHAVAAFHRGAKLPVVYPPQWPSSERVALRLRLIREEVVDELFPYLEHGPFAAQSWEENLAEVGDAIADSIYVLAGTALEFGIPLHKIMGAVQKANMDKRWPDGTFHHDAGGKVLKPPGWTPPDIVKIITEERS